MPPRAPDDAGRLFALGRGAGIEGRQPLVIPREACSAVADQRRGAWPTEGSPRRFPITDAPRKRGARLSLGASRRVDGIGDPRVHRIGARLAVRPAGLRLHTCPEPHTVPVSSREVREDTGPDGVQVAPGRLKLASGASCCAVGSGRCGLRGRRATLAARNDTTASLTPSPQRAGRRRRATPAGRRASPPPAAPNAPSARRSAA